MTPSRSTRVPWVGVKGPVSREWVGVKKPLMESGGGARGRAQVPEKGCRGTARGGGGAVPVGGASRGRGHGEAGSPGRGLLPVTHPDESCLSPSALWREPHGAHGHHPVPRLPRALPQQPQLCVEDHGPRRRWHPGRSRGETVAACLQPLRAGTQWRPTVRKTQQLPA